MRRLIERIDSRPWSGDFLARAVGHHIGNYFCHALDPAMRESAASGGTVTAVLAHLLKTGRIDGALIVTSVVADGKLVCRFDIARTPEEILAAQGSKYAAVHFHRDAVPLIRAFSGRLAVVLLPCDAKSLRRLRIAEPEVDAKIAFVITLFCGHNSEPELTDAMIRRYGKNHGALRSYQYRFGHWRGKLRIRYEDGAEVTRPFSDFSVYQNLFFFSQKKCHACFDHLGFYCDLAAGDIWSQKMKQDPIKKNAIVIRSPRAAELLAELGNDRVLHVEPVTIDDVCNGQSRALPFHYNVSARSRVGRLFGMRLKDVTRVDAKWNQVIVAFLVMLNERITRGRTGQRLVLATPRPILKAYLLFLKGLESL